MTEKEGQFDKVLKASLEQWERSHDEQFEQEQKELVRLSNEAIEENRKIESGLDTSVEQLDKHLAAEAAFYHWCAQHPEKTEPWETSEYREEMGIQYLKTQKILNGSYQHEKAAYCAEGAQEHMRKAEKSEQELTAGEKAGYEEHTRHLIVRSRKWAANWLRTEANCLDMPDQKHTPPPPQATER